MPISVRLKPELERLLKAAVRRERKSRTAIVHEALILRLRMLQPRLGDVIRGALVDAPAGFELGRAQPRKVERRAWKR